MANEKEMNVIGMHCPSCVAAVELELKDVDGVSDAKANLENNTVVITFEGEPVEDAVLEEAIEDAGFKVE